MRDTDHKCQRCGCTLKVETVQVLVERDAEDAPVTVSHWEDREEVSDCPRCTGSY